MLYPELSHKIIEAYYEVYNELGYGFLESVYEKSFIHVLQSYNLHGSSQVPIQVFFRTHNVGLYYADIMVEKKIIIELKAVESLHTAHEVQLMNYLRATNIELGFLFNFGPQPSFKRKIFENRYKKSVPIS